MAYMLDDEFLWREWDALYTPGHEKPKATANNKAQAMMQLMEVINTTIPAEQQKRKTNSNHRPAQQQRRKVQTG